MRTFVRLLVLVVPVTLMVSPVSAQSPHAAPQSAIDAALQRHVSTTAADREVVQQVLEQSEVKAIAQQMGVNVLDAQRAVATLDGAELARVAAQARLVQDSLAGGQSRIVISTTLIIIALLVLILIIVAVD